MVGLHGKAGSDALASQVRSVVLDHLGSWILDLGSWILDLESSNLTCTRLKTINLQMRLIECNAMLGFY